MAIDWKDQVHKAAGRTDRVTWALSPMNILADGGVSSPLEVLGANNNRVGMFLQNVGDDSIYFGFDNTVKPATPSAGDPKFAFRLASGEAKWEYLGEGVLVNSIFAVTDNGATSKLAFYETY